MAMGNLRPPVDDLTYDVIAVLHDKARALSAYDRYLLDARGNEELTALFTRLRRVDEEHVRMLKEVLADRLELVETSSSLAAELRAEERFALSGIDRRRE